MIVLNIVYQMNIMFKYHHHGLVVSNTVQAYKAEHSQIATNIPGMIFEFKFFFLLIGGAIFESKFA